MRRTGPLVLLVMSSSLLLQCAACGSDSQNEPLCEPPTEDLRDDCFISEEDIVNVNNRDDLEPFCTSRCTKLPGGLRINGVGLDGMTDLSVFRNVKSVDQFIAVTNTKDLRSLEGLENVESLLRLEITENERLRSLKGLENLKEVGVLEISNNPGLTSLEGLDRLEVFFEESEAPIEIRNNDSLEELDGFPVLKEAATISIQGNDNLKRITGFPQLERTRLGLRILQNSRLETLAGAFPEVQVVPGLTIEGNPMLPQCDAMAFVERVENDPDRTTVEGNPQLACGE